MQEAHLMKILWFNEWVLFLKLIRIQYLQPKDNMLSFLQSQVISRSNWVSYSRIHHQWESLLIYGIIIKWIKEEIKLIRFIIPEQMKVDLISTWIKIQILHSNKIRLSKDLISSQTKIIVVGMSPLILQILILIHQIRTISK